MKKILISLLKALGYTITKVHKKPFWNTDVTVTVGTSKLKMPSFNPLTFTYKENPQFASELSRITRFIHDKYPSMTIIDVGANVGDSATIMKNTLNIPIISIEGDKTSFQYLKKNTERFQDIILINKFLGENDHVIQAKIEKSGWNNTIVPVLRGDIKLELVKLDTLLNSQDVLKNKNIKFLKIDTEGFDTIILRGAIETIKKHHPIIFIEYNLDNMKTIGEDGLSSLTNLRKFGYEDIHFYDDRGRFIIACKLSNEGILKDLHHYIENNKGLIYYYNICIFDNSDADIADAIAINERLQ